MGFCFFLYNYTEKIINTQHIHNYGFREAYYKYCGRSIVIGALHFGCGGRQNDKRLFVKRGNNQRYMIHTYSYKSRKLLLSSI